MPCHVRCLAVVPVLLATAATPLSALGQAVPSQQARVIEEIIVTARKREESVQDVPIAMTALSAELSRPSIRNLTDLNGFSPNVQIGADGSRSGGGASITIRGISPTRTDDNSFDSPIGVMIDGIYLGSLAGQVLDNFDIERIEILRGPQGTLFGKNTVGGVVHVIRTRPTGELGMNMRATVGENGQREIRLVGNTPVIEDLLALKLFGTYQEEDGFMRNITTGGKSGKRDYHNFGATLLVTPADTYEAVFTAERFRDKSPLSAFNTNYNVGPGVIPPPTDPNETDYSEGFLACTLNPDICRTSLDRPRVSENDTENDSDLKVDAFTLNMKWELNEHLSLHSVTGYRDLKEYRIYDFDGSAAPFITIERWNDYDQFSQEFRLDGSWNNLSVTSGIYYWNTEFTQDWVTGARFWATLFGGVAYNPAAWQGCIAGDLAPVFCDSGLPNGVTPGDDVTQILYETQETTSVAAYTQFDWTFAPNWTLTAGIRWTEERKDFIAGQAYLSNVERQRERNFPELVELNRTWREWSPKLGLTYNWGDNAIVYASYAEGFHSGGFFGVNQNIRDFVRDQYDPEFAESYELGLKSMWLDNRLRLNITAFRNDFTDKQEASVQVDPDTLTVATVFDNVADARYQGIELETEFVVNDYLRLFLNYGYLDAKYLEFETDINASDGVTIIEDASFLTPRNAPKNTFGVGGTVSIPMGPGIFEVYGKYAWVDKVETSLLNTPLARVSSREDVTGTIGYYTDNWSVVLFGRNLTNQRFETFIPVATLFAAGTVNRPRTFGLEFSYQM